MLAEILAYNKSAFCRSVSAAFSFVLFYTVSNVWLQHLFIKLEIRQEEPVSYIYALRGPLHSNSFSCYLCSPCSPCSLCSLVPLFPSSTVLLVFPFPLIPCSSVPLVLLVSLFLCSPCCFVPLFPLLPCSPISPVPLFPCSPSSHVPLVYLVPLLLLFSCYPFFPDSLSH